MNIRKILILLMLSCSSGFTAAQSSVNENTTESLAESMKGTFQIVVYGEEAPQLSADLLQYIESKRESEKTILLKYNENFTIRIFPDSMINSGSFSRETYPLYVYRNQQPKATEMKSGKFKNNY